MTQHHDPGRWQQVEQGSPMPPYFPPGQTEPESPPRGSETVHSRTIPRGEIQFSLAIRPWARNLIIAWMVLVLACAGVAAYAGVDYLVTKARVKAAVERFGTDLQRNLEGTTP